MLPAFNISKEHKDAYSNGALGPLAFAGVSDTIPQCLRYAGDVGGAENGTGMDAAQIRQLVARPASRHEVHGDQFLLGQDQQTVWIVVACQKITTTHSTVLTAHQHNIIQFHGKVGRQQNTTITN